MTIKNYPQKIIEIWYTNR